MLLSYQYIISTNALEISDIKEPAANLPMQEKYDQTHQLYIIHKHFDMYINL